MALDFPANPTNGQIFGSYVWSASKGVWQSREESAAPAVVSPVPPTTPTTGDIWVDSSDGVSYVYYDDGTSGQWIEMISSGVPQLSTKANLAGGNTFTGTQVLSTPLGVASGGTGTNSGTLSDNTIRRIVNPAGALLNSGSSSVTGAIRITLPVGWTSHMHKFTVSVYDYTTSKSFTVEIAGYNFSGTGWFNPTAYITGQRNANVNYTVRFGYTAGGKACVYIGETNSTWTYPQIAVNNVFVGFADSSATWLSGWVVDFVTSFENVSQTIANTQIVAGLVPMLPTSVSLGSGSSSVSALGEVTFSGATSVQLNGVFTDAYTNYKVLVRGSSEDNRGYAWRFTAGGTQNTNAFYHYTMLWTAGSVGTASQNNANYMGYSLGHRYFAAEGSILGPRLVGQVKHLYVYYSGLTNGAGGNENHSIAGAMRDGNYIADGIIFFPSAGTISGTMQVLGVAK